MTATLSRSDFIRAPLLARADPRDYKEWQHFIVHGPDCHVLINFSLSGDLSSRVIVIALDRRWTGAVERFDASSVQVSPISAS